MNKVVKEYIGVAATICAMLFIAIFVIGCGNTLRGVGQTLNGVGQDINNVVRN